MILIPVPGAVEPPRAIPSLHRPPRRNLQESPALVLLLRRRNRYDASYQLSLWGFDKKSLLPKKSAKYEWDLSSSCTEEEKCEHVKSLLPRDISAVCSWHFILTQTHSLLNGSLEGLWEGRNNQMLKEYQNMLKSTLKRLLKFRSDHNVKQDNLSTVRTEERKTLPAPPPPPKPVDTHTSNFRITFFSATFTY